MGDGDLTRWEVHMKKIFVVLALAFAFITASAMPMIASGIYMLIEAVLGAAT